MVVLTRRLWVPKVDPLRCWVAVGLPLIRCWERSEPGGRDVTASFVPGLSRRGRDLPD